MISTVALLGFALLGVAGLSAMAVGDHRREMRRRAGLLDGLARHFEGSRIDVGGDGFPTLTARLADRRALTVSLLVDTLVMRRLPQLWLIVTLHERVEMARPSIGALTRHTGAEFYSRTLKFPERIESPAGLETLLLRGDRPFMAAEMDRIGAVLASVFHDPYVKEIAATPRGVRLVRQVAEGERGAHLLLRQSRFSTVQMALAPVTKSIADANALRETLDTPAGLSLKLSA